MATFEDASVAGNVLANDGDPDGDPLAIVAVNGLLANVGVAVAGSAGGTFTVQADGTIAFDPGTDFDHLAAGQTQTTTVTYTLRDGDGSSDTATVTVTITGINDAPGSTPIPTQTHQDADVVSLDLAAFFSDTDTADVLTYTAADLPAGLTLDPLTGLVSGTLAAAASAGSPYSVTVTVTDPSGATTVQTFAWQVTNPGPVAVDDTRLTTENTGLFGNVLANDHDPDGDPLAVVAVQGAAGSVGTGRGRVRRRNLHRAGRRDL